MAEPWLCRDAVAGKEGAEAGAGCGPWAPAQTPAQPPQTPGLLLLDVASGCGQNLRAGKLGEAAQPYTACPLAAPAPSRA